MVTPMWLAWPVRSADDVVVDAVLLEGVVAQVAPQHGEHAEVVGLRERLGDLLDLAGRLVGAEVDGGARRRRRRGPRPAAREPNMIWSNLFG